MSTLKYALKILLFVLSLSAVPVYAQGGFYANGHFLTKLDVGQPRTVLLAFSECVVREQPGEVDELLATRVYSPRAQEFIADLVNSGGDSRCLSYSRQPAGRLEMEEPAFRGALSEVLYYQRFPEVLPELTNVGRAQVISDEDAAKRLEASSSIQEEMLMIFGDCVVAHAPSHVDRLLRTEIGSEEEIAAIQSMGEFFGGCLWEGQTAEFNVENLRWVLAAAAYRVIPTMLENADVDSSESDGMIAYQYSEASE